MDILYMIGFFIGTTCAGAGLFVTTCWASELIIKKFNIDETKLPHIPLSLNIIVSIIILALVDNISYDVHALQKYVSYVVFGIILYATVYFILGKVTKNSTRIIKMITTFIILILLCILIKNF